MEELALMQNSYPPGADGMSIMNRVMTRIGSDDDSARLCGVGKNIQSLKSRLWEGITPLSDSRWQEKGLDLPENFEEAFQHLSAVVAAFEYLNAQQVQENLRVTFNLIHDIWESLDKVLNQRRAETGAEHISLANLWTIYMTAHLGLVTQRAHKWVTQHVDALRAPLLENLLSHQSLTEGSGAPDEMQWKLTNALHALLEVSVRADYWIMMPMEGYKGYAAPEIGSGPPEMYVADVAERGKAYSGRVKTLSHKIMFDKLMGEIISGQKAEQKNSGETYHESAREQIDAQIEVRRELRGDSIDSVLQEPWITSKLHFIESAEEKKDNGLAIYRLTYGQSDDEWLEFVQRLETHICHWGKGQTGSEAIKPHLKLHWIDGRELGFAEGDFEAAKRFTSFRPRLVAKLRANSQSRHFNEVLNDGSKDDQGSEIPLELQQNAFLAIDLASFESYTTESYGAPASTMPPGDFTGFVLAIDPDFDPKEGVSRPDESPGYNGQMRVLGSLVWGDLYAILESQSASLQELWPLAMHHPNKVYVGPTVPLQLCNWQSHGESQPTFMTSVTQYVKAKLGWA